MYLERCLVSGQATLCVASWLVFQCFYFLFFIFIFLSGDDWAAERVDLYFR